MKSQSGFTLVEIAIVLVIIGLLLGGVLKGQELINQAKIKNIANDLSGIAAAIYAYQDRYRSYPGDDPGAARWNVGGVALTVSATAGNGQVTGAFNSSTDTDESRRFWQHLRFSGLITGDTASLAQPQNAVGGLLGVQTNAGPAAAVALSGLVACQSNLLGRIAEALDNQLDDGRSNGGTVRGFTQAGVVTPGGADPTTAAAAAAYVDDGTTMYTVCKTI